MIQFISAQIQHLVEKDGTMLNVRDTLGRWLIITNLSPVKNEFLSLLAHAADDSRIWRLRAHLNFHFENPTFGSVEIVELLMKSGASPCIPDKVLKTPLYGVVNPSDSRTPHHCKPLHTGKNTILEIQIQFSKIMFCCESQRRWGSQRSWRACWKTPRLDRISIEFLTLANHPYSSFVLSARNLWNTLILSINLLYLSDNDSNSSLNNVSKFSW